jgi:hypothetical protein
MFLFPFSQNSGEGDALKQAVNELLLLDSVNPNLNFSNLKLRLLFSQIIPVFKKILFQQFEFRTF